MEEKSLLNHSYYMAQATAMSASIMAVLNFKV
jgi:hypothetical protein